MHEFGCKLPASFHAWLYGPQCIYACNDCTEAESIGISVTSDRSIKCVSNEPKNGHKVKGGALSGPIAPFHPLVRPYHACESRIRYVSFGRGAILRNLYGLCLP